MKKRDSTSFLLMDEVILSPIVILPARTFSRTQYKRSPVLYDGEGMLMHFFPCAALDN